MPAVTLPAVDVGGTHYPAQHYSAQHYSAQHYAATHYAGQCFNAPAAFAPANTSLLPTDAYRVVDAAYSAELTNKYWDSAGNSINNPDPTASGFGEFNAAGFPKNEYVRPYVRQDGTMVSGYWRNSPTDGLPTCQLIKC